MISSASTKRVANAVGGKTARACDSCLKKRARWYCAADDAFLCQSCDSSVHSANSLSSRHERVRLQTASFKSVVTNNVPSWPHRKARTRRNGKSRQVPEVGSDDQASNEEEIAQRMVHRVPIYDPFVAEEEEDKSLRGFLASEMDMTEFAADVESLLGRGVNQELGLVTERIKEDNSNGMVKEEETVSFELGFDYDEEELSPELCWGGGDDREIKGEVGVEKKHKLRLDYEAVISAWGSQGGCPWTTGSAPDYFPHESWPDCLGTCETELHHPNGEHINGIGGGGQTAILGDGDREARVSRYREKRSTRLFSKKIRYEVRKLNAEKRPRMKGRFVKRSIFSGAAFPLLHQ